MSNLDDNYWVKYYNITNVTSLKCDKDHPADVYALSKICSHVELEECFHEEYHNPDDYGLQLFAAIWIIFIMTVGIFGNLLTLTAIPYALWKKRYKNDHYFEDVLNYSDRYNKW